MTSWSSGGPEVSTLVFDSEQLSFFQVDTLRSPPGSNLVAGKVSGITGLVHPLKDGKILPLLHDRTSLSEQ